MSEWERYDGVDLCPAPLDCHDADFNACLNVLPCTEHKVDTAERGAELFGRAYVRLTPKGERL